MTDQAKRQRLSKLLIEYVGADKERPLSGRQFARLLDVNATSAQAYLDGVTFPGEAIRKRIAKLLGLTYEALEAAIEGVELSQKLSIEQICQEIRSVEDEDFADVVAVVAEEVARRLKIAKLKADFERSQLEP
jgi:transcriptional regulator with XRE-family HTH domain